MPAPLGEEDCWAHEARMPLRSHLEATTSANAGQDIRQMATWLIPKVCSACTPSEERPVRGDEPEGPPAHKNQREKQTHLNKATAAHNALPSLRSTYGEFACAVASVLCGHQLLSVLVAKGLGTASVTLRISLQGGCRPKCAAHERVHPPACQLMLGGPHAAARATGANGMGHGLPSAAWGFHSELPGTMSGPLGAKVLASHARSRTVGRSLVGWFVRSVGRSVDSRGRSIYKSMGWTCIARNDV